MTQKDHLYAQSRKVVEAFRFDNEVASVFDDMITRSVPGYTMMLDMLGVLAEQCVQDDSVIYDLGCSLGASTLSMLNNIQSKNNRVIAVDNAPAMVERCQSVINNKHYATPVEITCQDILDIKFLPCSLVSMNLTLQFISLEERPHLLTRIADAMLSGGVMFLSEKVCFENALEQEQMTALHHQFKKHQGYSDLEIAQKRNAIENVLIPESIDAHKQRLLEAGFSDVFVALQCFNFVSLIAVK